MNRSAATVLAELEARNILPVAERIANTMHVSIDAMVASRTHERSVCMARHAMWAELHAVPFKFSHRTIASIFGVARTTVLEGIRSHEDRVRLVETIGTDNLDRLAGLEARIEGLEKENTHLRSDLVKANDRIDILRVGLEGLAQRRAS